MKKIPWKGLAVSCGTLAILVLFRCIITAGRLLYYGSAYWKNAIMQDPWFYIGMVSAAVCACALLVLAKQEEKENNVSEDGCEE